MRGLSQAQEQMTANFRLEAYACGKSLNNAMWRKRSEFLFFKREDSPPELPRGILNFRCWRFKWWILRRKLDNSQANKKAPDRRETYL